MTVSPIRKDDVLDFDQWTSYRKDHELAEMSKDRTKTFVGLGVRVFDLGWLWETVDLNDHVKEFGIELTTSAVKLAAEASAKRILLAA